MAEIRPTNAYIGLNLNSITGQVKSGQLTHAQNAVVESFDGNSVVYQNEQGNEFCVNFPTGYKYIGSHNIVEKDIIIFWLVNPTTGDSEIGKVVNNSCIYERIINAKCLNFSRRHPVKKAVHRVTNCTTEVYWTDGYNRRRWIDLENLPYKQVVQSTNTDPCNIITTSEIDCNKLNVQPNFSIPQVTYEKIESAGSTVAGVYQFAIQYSNAQGDEYTSYYSVTDPIPIADYFKVTPDFNYLTAQSIELLISNLDITGVFDYFNLAVIKTTNNITSVDLVATYQIQGSTQKVLYTGQSKANITLSIDDIFEKFPAWEIADDLTTVQDVLVWDGMTSTDRISLQKVFNQVSLQWVSWRLPPERKQFKDPINAALYRGYMRDEVYAFDAVVIYKNGYQSDRFHIPGRKSKPSDLVLVDNKDSKFATDVCIIPEPKPYWQVYNSGSKLDDLFTPCVESNDPQIPQPPPTNIAEMTVSVHCSDGNCHQQGEVSLTFSLPQALTSSLTLLVGQVRTQGMAIQYSGSDLFTPPMGATPISYYSPNANVPFAVTIPAGVTSYTTPGNLKLLGEPSFNNVWICQSCTLPITDLYFKAQDNRQISLTVTNAGITTHLINQTLSGETIKQPEASTTPTPPSTSGCKDGCYEGPYQYGDFAYWESTETYPCNEAVWGDLQGQKIRHHKFPDNSISPHHDDDGNVYPMGVQLDMQQLYNLIKNSPDLTDAQKENIAEIKITRANRANDSSIVAKGLFYNVGLYAKDNAEYFYPNYPYNDLRKDPFISKSSNLSTLGTIKSVNVNIASDGSTENIIDTENINLSVLIRGSSVTFTGITPGSTTSRRWKINVNGQTIFDSLPIVTGNGGSWILEVTSILSGNESNGNHPIKFNTVLTLSGSVNKSVTNEDILTFNDQHGDPLEKMDLVVAGVIDGDIVLQSIVVKGNVATSNIAQLEGFTTDESFKRFTFHSPDTSFYQPHLGNIMKFESVEYGITQAHFTQVKGHARYKFPSLESYLTALVVGAVVGFLSGTYGTSDNVFNGTAAFTAFTVFNDIMFKLLPRKNFAYSFNSTGDYTKSVAIPNGNGDKIRQLDIANYLIPGVQGVGDVNVVNNYQREGSVYLRATDTLPAPSSIDGVPEDNSRFVLGEVNCQNLIYKRDISAYYGSIKVTSPDQYGQITSYESVDTGYQFLFDVTLPFDPANATKFIFGGDTFINKFAFKRKLPFFLDNRVNFPDDADIAYEDVGNIGFPTYWFSTDITQGTGNGGTAISIGQLFGVKVNHFDCKRQDSSFFYDAGKIYLFAYGIPEFFVESTVNVDYRQAYNNKEGDYYPHVSGAIPDEWVQEINVPINFDNTYTYNKSFSKQNIENVFSVLPVNFIPNQQCKQVYPNRAIYSDVQQDPVNETKNNWLIYRPASYFDFPLNYGKLITLEGIENREVLARFENKSMIYNAYLSINTSTPKAVYIGNDSLFKSAPPIDFAETDLGYAGSQHSFFLRTEFGNVSIDAKRGNVFIIGGQKLTDIGDENLDQFFCNNLKFSIQDAFPEYDVDNAAKGVGLHGIYDTKYKRIIITKLDYTPLDKNIKYNSTTDEFTLNDKVIQLTDSRYFCSVSFTISYWFKNKAWVSFHSYLPNFYIGAIDLFYTGLNDSTITLPGAWRHNTTMGVFNTYYGQICPYIIEYPFTYKNQDEILQAVMDYTKVNRITDYQSFVQTNNVFFNKAIIYNDQQCSGVLNLINKPQNNLKLYLQYPKYNIDSRDILFVKSDNFYNYNGFWDIVKDSEQPIWRQNCLTLPNDKILNTNNLNYSNRSFKKYQIRAKDCKIRHILDNRGDVRMTSQFLLTETQVSYK